MKRLKAPISDQSGQAVVEYILLLVIVLAITLGGLWQFNTAFKSFAESYFGSYLQCLLETGEIPSIGQDSGKSGATCNDSYKAFSLADGRSANGSTIGSSSGSGSGSGGKDGSKGSSSSSGNSGGGSSDGSKIGGLNGSFGRSSGRPVTAVEKPEAKEDGAPGDAGVMGGGGRGRVNMPSSAKEKRAEVQLTGPGGADAEAQDDRHENKKVSETGENRLRKKKELVVPQRKVAAADADDTDEGFTFGYLMRWLLIGAMILALVIFLGQQGLAISNSQE